MRMTVLILALVANAGLAAAPARAQGLAGEADLNAGLVVIAAGDRIRRRCPDIDARMVRAIAYMRGLGQRALDRGYTRADIEAYVGDEAAKARVEASAGDYLASRGLGAGEPEDYCRLGRAEIAADSQIGRLLSAN